MRRYVGLLLRLHALRGTARPFAIALAGLLALGVFTAGTPSPARADPLPEFPQITIDPTCEAQPSSDGSVITVTVRGYSFSFGRVVSLYWDGNLVQSPGDAIQVQPTGYIEATFSETIFGSSDPTSHTINAFYQDQPPDDSGSVPPVATTYINVPCSTDTSHITLTPDCGSAGAPITIHIDGGGFFPGDPLGVTVKGLFDDTVYGSIDPAVPADPNAVSLEVTATLPGIGAYRVIAAQQYPPGVEGFDPLPIATAYFVVPCSQASVSPTCGPQGSGPDRYSIQVSGQGFLPGLPVTIVFDAAGQAEYFYGQFQVNQDGTWGPAEIQPYARGPGVYSIVIEQSNDSPVLHRTVTQFSVECPPPGGVTLNPTCASPQFTGDQPQTFQLNVSGAGFQANLPIIVTFDPDRKSGPSFTPETSQVAADGGGNFSATLNVAARPAGQYRIAVEQQVNGSVIEGNVPPFNMPCAPPSAKITAVKPNCGDDVNVNPAPYSVEVVGRGFIPGFVQLVFDFDGAQELFSTTANGNGRFDATITPTARPAGSYRIAAQQADANAMLDQAFASFGVPCSETLLIVTPNSTSPGFVVTVHGTGFPANKPVELRWSYGIGAAQPIEVTADATGSFDRQVLIFAHDFVGERQVTAGMPGSPNAFPGAEATLLVEAGQGSPPSYPIFGGDPSDQPPIILRR
ncbi:MAG TPA: hypothetical protein VH371_00850 [Candidatus Limnocylindrales bacterium]